MNVSARHATTPDLDDLVRLDAALRVNLGELRGGPVYLLRNSRQQPVRDSYAADLDSDDKLLIVGTIDSYPVGFGAAGIRKLDDGYRLAEITEIFVAQETREVGVGGTMMAMIMEWARSSGADGIDSRAMPGDRGTKNFFESNGLVARAIFVHRDLRQP